jgi:hypothetical protein
MAMEFYVMPDMFGEFCFFKYKKAEKHILCDRFPSLVFRGDSCRLPKSFIGASWEFHRGFLGASWLFPWSFLGRPGDFLGT